MVCAYDVFKQSLRFNNYISYYAGLICLVFATAVGAEQTPLDIQPSTPDTKNKTVRILLHPYAKATVSSQMNARLEKFPYELGERFKKGATLAEFDCSVLKQELRKVNAELDIARAKHDSNKKLKEYQSVSDLELAISGAEVAKNRAQVGVVAARNRYCVIRAPYAGRIIKRHVNPSENVSQGQPVIDIISDGKLEVQILVPSNWVAWLHPQMPFKIEIDETKQTYTAKVTRVVGQIDPVSQTVEVVASIDSKTDDLLPGMSGTAHFATISE